MNRIITVCIVTLLLHAGAQAQLTLKQKIGSNRNLKAIMGIVQKHLAEEARSDARGTEAKEREKEMYFWQRWAKRNEHRVDGNGNLYANPDSIVNQEWKAYRQNPAALRSPLSGTANWISMGPFNVTYTATSNSDGLGRINCIAFHPTDANIMLAGSPQGGIWKTTNGGNYWYNINDDLANMGIGGLSFDRTNPNIIIALTGDGDGSYGIGGQWLQNSTGIIKSYDGGVTWQTVLPFGSGSTPSGIVGFKLMQHPYNSSIFLAATSQGIFRSTNGGNTWVNEQFGIFTDIEVKPDGTGAVMYAVRFSNGGNYFFKSTNSGDTWAGSAINNIAGNTRCAISVTNANSNTVYLLAGSDRNIVATNRMYQGVFKSTDEGNSFTRVCTTPNILNIDVNGAGNGDQSNYDLAIAVNPANEQEVISGGILIWRSTNGNSNPMTFSRASWWEHNNSNNNVNYVHADVHELSYNPLNNRLYACHDGGVSVSTNNGVNWITISNSMHTTASVYGDWLESNPAVLCVGTQDNGTMHRHTASDNYRNIGGGDGGGVLINQTNGNDIVYAATGGVFRTTSPGVNQTYISPVVDSILNNFYPILARSYNDDNVIYLGGARKLYRSSNRGSSWDSSAAIINCTNILTTCRSSTNRIYTGNTGALYRSNDFGATLTLISNNPGFNPNGMPIADVEATHAVSGTIYACVGGYTPGQKVFFSNDAGANWSNVSGSLPNLACHSIVLDGANNVYVGTDAGVFVRPAGQNDWRPYFNGLPRTPVQDLKVNQTFNRLMAITYGHGNFYTDLYTNTCPPSLALTGNVTGNKLYEATNVTANATVSGGAGTAITVGAETEVLLEDGFTVTEDNAFRAYNAPCGTVGVPLRVTSLTDPVSMERLVLKASDRAPFPYGHINRLPNGGYQISYADSGQYAIRITDQWGNPVQPAVTKVVAQAGKEPFDVAKYPLPVGLYYIQLFKEQTLVHFLEYEIGGRQ
jgi:hypothetical protein